MALDQIDAHHPGVVPVLVATSNGSMVPVQAIGFLGPTKLHSKLPLELRQLLFSEDGSTLLLPVNDAQTGFVHYRPVQLSIDELLGR